MIEWATVSGIDAVTFIAANWLGLLKATAIVLVVLAMALVSLEEVEND